MACNTLKFSDVGGLARPNFSAWKSGKVSFTHENGFSDSFLFSFERLSHHCRIQHSCDRVCGNEEMKREINAFKRLIAAETLNNIAILS